MNRSAILTVVFAAVFIAACATTTTTAPAPAAEGESRFLIDPRIGYTGTATVSARQFESAWRLFLQGDDTQARKRFGELRSRNPEYTPAALAEAAIDIREGHADAAKSLVQRIADRDPSYTAARVYEAEIALAEHNNSRAYDIYKSLQTQPDAPPTVAERVQSIRDKVFGELYTNAESAPDAEAVRMLREALDINPAAADARLLLTRRLIAQKNYEEARRALEPLVNSAELDRPEVQELLAEIDAGRGRYQEAIVRYERLARRTREPRYNARLEEIKATWNAMNMPPQFTAALESPEITRSDLAVLLYWTVSSVRFAQNLNSPPIAIDISDMPGREEIIRAIALGLYDVDPVTRRVGPTRPVSASMLTKLVGRLLVARGAACAQSVSLDPADTRSQRVLAACGIADPSAGLSPDAPISGRTAAAILDRVEKAFAQ